MSDPVSWRRRRRERKWVRWCPRITRDADLLDELLQERAWALDDPSVTRVVITSGLS
jgi:hypothetical protein